MHITNQFNLTDAFVEAVEYDDYSKGESDFTVTQLLKPPQLDKLFEAHKDELTEDASERVWSLLGQAVHAVLERRTNPSELKEERLYVTMMGKKIGGKFDSLHLEGKTLTDYKITSAWGALYGKEEWDQQLNILRYLCVKNGYDIEKLQIQGIWRDWDRYKAMNDKKYPKAPSTVIEIDLWPMEDTESFMLQRLQDHLGEPPRPCSPAEMWYRGESWALMKKGRKSAVKVEPTKEALVDYAIENDLAWSDALDVHLAPGHYLQFREGEYKRCENYCPVRLLCPQYHARMTTPASELAEKV